MTVRTADIRQLEEIGARTWPARTIQPFGGWLLSLDRGVTRRANSVLPNRWTGGPSVDDGVGSVERRYRRSGLRPCFKMTQASQPEGLDGLLHRRGYRAEGYSIVLTRPADRIHDLPELPVDLASQPTPDWIAGCWPGPGDDADVEARCGIVGRIGGPRAFALARVDGRPAGAAMAAVVQGWGCVTAVHTLPVCRRRGVARAMIAALAAWARRQQARSLFLQVEADNAAAHGLYSTLGFRPAYRYHYRTLTGPAV